jgi:hypothetical protein
MPESKRADKIKYIRDKICLPVHTINCQNVKELDVTHHVRTLPVRYLQQIVSIHVIGKKVPSSS